MKLKMASFIFLHVYGFSNLRIYISSEFITVRILFCFRDCIAALHFSFFDAILLVRWSCW